MKCFVESAGVFAPGLSGWQASAPALSGQAAYVAAALALPKLEMLPPVERRRTGLPVKLAMAAGQDALARSNRTADALATVFTASGGDGEVINEICTVLAGADRQVSPTRFHNSVHNAPAGYWGIASGSHAPSISLCALDWSFPAGLIEAASQLAAGLECVLLIACDVPYPEPLRGMRPVTVPFGCALLLGREHGAGCLAALELSVGPGKPPTRMADSSLERMRGDNPAARALPLLAAIASARGSSVILDYVAGNALAVEVSA